MRRFIHAITIAGALIPAVASAQTIGDNGGGNTTGSSNGSSDALAPSTTAAPTQTQTGLVTSTSALSDRGTTATSAAASTPAPLPFAGSILILDQSVSGDTLDQSGVLSPVPSYQWWISLRPRWQVTDFLSFRARGDLTVEWLNGSDTTLYRQPDWGDIWTDLVLNHLPTFAGIKPTVGIRAIWGLSLESQYRTMIVNPQVTAGLSRAFEDPAGGKLTLSLGLSGGHPIYREANGVLRTTFPCTTTSSFEAGTCQTLGGSENVEWAVTGSAGLAYDTPLKGLSVNLTYLLINQWRYLPPETTVTDPMGGSYTVPRSANDTRQRTYGWWLASLDYEVTKWASASVGWYTYRLVVDENGQYGNPFWSLSSSATTRVFFSLTMALDEVYDAVTGRTAHTAAAARRPGTTTTASNNGHGWSINQTARELRQQQMQNGLF